MVQVQTRESRAPRWLTRNVRVLSAVSFLQDAASDLLYPLLPIYLTSVLGAPAAVVGAVEGAAEGAASLTKLAAGPLGDRFARRPLIATGYGMAALGKVIVAAATGWPGVLAGRVVDRLGKGVRDAPRDALLVEDIDDAARGRVFGFHRAMDTLGAVVGPLLGLAGYELLDHQIAPLLWVAVVPAVLSVLLVFLVARPADSEGAGAASRSVRTRAGASTAVLAGDDGARRVRHRQLPRCSAVVAAQRDRLLGGRGDPRLRRLQRWCTHCRAIRLVCWPTVFLGPRCSASGWCSSRSATSGSA